jgi:transcriptional regulator with XRE-family HTH domain
MKTDAEIRDIIRHNIKQLRIDAGKTQSDIAAYCGKSENAVGSWEQGLSLPDLVTMVKLARLYGVTLDYLYGEVDE